MGLSKEAIASEIRKKFFDETVKKEVIVALKKFSKGDSGYMYPCNYVESHLEDVFIDTFTRVEFNLSQEVLKSSKDSGLYHRFNGLIHPNGPFQQPEDPLGVEEERLRKRFVDLSIKNLETGVFELKLEYPTTVWHRFLTVMLVLHPNYKGK